LTPDLILAIDNGTQSVRALAIDGQGSLVAKTRVPIQPYYSTALGLAEQDPQVYWDAVCQATRQLWQYGVDPQRIACLSLTTQRSTMINVDAQGKPLRPAIVWLDQRRTQDVRPVGGLWGLAFKLAGMSQTVAYLQAEAEANWLQKHQPEIWKNTHKYLLLSGYLTYLLTGKFVDSVGCQVAYIPFDYKKLRWSSRWDWKWQAVPIEPDKLVDLVPPAGLLGEITPWAAEQTGLPAGLPMVAAAADKACEVIGSGCLEPHIGCLSFGTSATINTIHRKYIEAIPLIPPYPAAVPGAYSLEFQIYRGFWMVSWFKEQFGQAEQKLANERGQEAEQLFDELLRKVPAGSDGLMLQPYWSPGLRVPGPEARGVVLGFNDVHTRAHLYRAIIEGLAYAMRAGAEQTAKRTHIPITEIRVAGGGSQSDAAMQLTADMFGLPASRPHVYEASGLGAAIDGAVGIGLHPDFETAVRAMTHPGDTFQPDAANHALYNQLYDQVYSQIYPRLKPLYERINNMFPVK